jgi:hypothetical protein
MLHLMRTCPALFLVALARAKSVLEGISYTGDSTSVDTLSDTCKAALAVETQCDPSLEGYALDNILPSSEDLEYICTQEFSDSLASTRKSIASGCASDNILYVYDNREYPMTRPIDKMIDTKRRACLRDA